MFWVFPCSYVMFTGCGIGMLLCKHVTNMYTLYQCCTRLVFLRENEPDDVNLLWAFKVRKDALCSWSQADLKFKRERKWLNLCDWNLLKLEANSRWRSMPYFQSVNGSSNCLKQTVLKIAFQHLHYFTLHDGKFICSHPNHVAVTFTCGHWVSAKMLPLSLCFRKQVATHSATSCTP